ncbi:MAG: serine hydrolase, partial [Planctomycetota bacterium]
MGTLRWALISSVACATLAVAGVMIVGEEAEAPPPTPWEEIESRLPSLAAAITRQNNLSRNGQVYLSVNRQVVAHYAWGAYTTDTMAPWASSTKPTTAAAFMKLVEAGVVGLDDTVEQHLPGFGQNGKEGVLIRHLLEHTGHLGVKVSPMTTDPWEVSINSIVEGPLEAGAVPGEVCRYNPPAFWIMGEILCRHHGKTFDRIARDEVYVPAGMTTCFNGMTAAEVDQHSGAIAPDWNSTKPGLEYTNPAGGTQGPMWQLGRFYEILHFDRGAIADGQLLTDATIREMTRIQAGPDGTYCFGLGFFINKVEPPTRYGTAPSPDSFGHNGAGGTIAFTDPRHNIVWASRGLTAADVDGAYADLGLPVIESAPEAQPHPALVGETVFFTVAASDPDGDALTYSWDFGDGASSSPGAEPGAGHFYAEAGTYTAAVTVSDGGNSTVEKVQVEVRRGQAVAAPAWAWAAAGGGASDEDNCRGVACDAAGNAYVTGEIRGSDCLLGGNSFDTVGGSADCYVVKYSLNGTPEWVRLFGGSGAEVGVDLDVDSTGSAIVVGTYGSETLDCGTGTDGQPVQVTLKSGARGVLVLKVDASGATEWASGFSGTGTCAGNEVAVGPDDEILVTGPFGQQGGTSLVLPDGTTLAKTGGDADVWVGKWSSAGEFLWGFALAGTGHEEGRGISVDTAGSVLLCGEFDDQLTLGSNTFSSLGGADAFVAKYAPDG